MKKILLGTALMSFSLGVLADAATMSNLHIQVANETSSVCRVVGDPTPKHGVFSNSPAYSIMSGDSKSFDIHEILFNGSEIDITYNCGGKLVTLHHKRPWSFCYINCPLPQTEVLRNDGIQVNLTTFAPYLTSPAQVNWYFRD